VRWLVGLLGALFMVVLASCAPNPEHAVSGILIDVQAAEIVHAETVNLRDNDGKVWSFRVSRTVADNPEESFSASHLRQHMMLAQPVEVRYLESTAGLEAIRIRDARS
jgi:hypothetical protein